MKSRGGSKLKSLLLSSVGYANPLRRIAQPGEQANVILFLCTDDASFVNGACIDSNGGAFMA
jgi:NAD(P)-dependent dehydrogenase (short-subunit alcohol dehydrogenase family)